MKQCMKLFSFNDLKTAPYILSQKDKPPVKKNYIYKNSDSFIAIQLSRNDFQLSK